MGMTLVNGYLALKFITDREPTPREFTYTVALAIYGKVEEVGPGRVVAATRGARLTAMQALVSRADPGALPYALFNGRALGLRKKRGEGPCRLCSASHASGVCKTCSTGLDTARPKPFWVFYPGKHGRQCYCQLMHDAGRM